MSKPTYKELEKRVKELEKMEEECKQVERNLKNTLKWYEVIFEGSRDAVFISDTDSKFISVNNAACELTGYSKDELLKMKIPEIHEEMDLDAYNTYFDRIMAGEKILSKAKILRKNGARVDAEFNNQRIEIQGRFYMHTVARDIIDRKKAEEELEKHRNKLEELVEERTTDLKESEEKYRMLFQGANDAIFYYELTEKGIPGRFLEVNDVACKRMGYTRDEFLKMTPKDIKDPALRKKLLQNVKKLQKEGRITFEMVHVSKDGKKIPVEISSNLFKFKGKDVVLSLARDITKRKKSEEALLLNSEMIKNMTEGVFVAGLDDLIIKYANPKFEEMFGYKAGEMIGKHVSIVNAPTDKDPEARAEEIMKVIKETGEWHGEISNIKKDGTPFWCYANVSVFDHPVHGTVLMAVRRDITERKKAEEKLKHSEQRLVQAQKIAKIGYWDWFMNSGELRWSLEVYDIFGQDPESFIVSAELFESCIHPEDLENFLKEREKFLDESEDTIIEHRIIRPDGEIKYVEERAVVIRNNSGDIVRIAGTVQDITVRKKAEERIKFASEILQIMDNNREAKSIIGNILDKIKDYTGFEAISIRLKEKEDYPYYTTLGFPDYFVEEERYLCERDADGEIVRDSQGNVYLECMCGNVICGRIDPKLSFFTKGGSFWTNDTSKLLATTSDKERQTLTRNRCNSEGYESVALIPLRSENETIGLLQFNDKRTGMFDIEMIEFFEGIGYSIGLTLAKKKSEEELNKAKDHLNQSERLAATGRLAASIAHEINNPLQALSFNLHFVKKALPKKFEENKTIILIETIIDRIKTTVKQLLDIHRNVRATSTIIDVNKVLISTVELLQNQLMINKIKVDNNLSAENPEVAGLMQDLHQVFMNMILNAQDAMKDGGVLEISTKTDKEKLKIVFKDNGSGISDTDIDHIFEPFYTTKSTTLGTGLGLSTSNGIINSMGGKISVKSAVGEGSEFTITLPIKKIRTYGSNNEQRKHSYH